jgi:hypothetical protein
MAVFNTSGGRSVPHFHLGHRPLPSKDFSPNAIKTLREEMATNFPNVQEVAPPTRRFNCHGHAYAADHGWFNQPDLFMADDFTVISLANVRRGDVIAYFNGSTLMHSAIVEHVNGGTIAQLRSKWGTRATVLHDLTDVPSDYGDPLVLRRRNPLIPS